MPTDVKILDLIKYIVCFATDHDIRLTTVRLVKFLYLADLFFARWHEGKTFTGYPWAFIYYGPYCSEAMASIDEATLKGLIACQTCESNYGNKDFSLYTCPTEDYLELRRSLPLDMISELQATLKKYGNDTAQLLDYVYFDTDPMVEAKQGDRLDFSQVKKPCLDSPMEMKKISKKNMEQIQAHLSNLGEKYKTARENLARDEQATEKWKDGLYNQALESFESEAIPTGMKGTAKIIS